MERHVYLDAVDPQRRLDPVGESDLSAEDVQRVPIPDHGVLLQAAGGVASAAQLIPGIVGCKKKETNTRWKTRITD